MKPSQRKKMKKLRPVKNKIEDAETSQPGKEDIHYPSIRPQNFRVVCDNMLQGLGRQLRCCGVDVRILSNMEDHDVAAEIAVKEDRIILTSGTPFSYLSSQVAIGNCFNVPCGDKAKDQAAIVLEHYNVTVTPQDIFSRCQICNGDKYLKVSPKEMRTCMDKKQKKMMVNSQQKSSSDPFQIPWEELRGSRPTCAVGRGRHDPNRPQLKYPRCIGRGRAMKEGRKNAGNDKISDSDLHEVVEKKLNISYEPKKTNPVVLLKPEFHEEEDIDELVICDNSPPKDLNPDDFVPIRSSSTASTSKQEFTPQIFHDKPISTCSHGIEDSLTEEIDKKETFEGDFRGVVTGVFQKNVPSDCETPDRTPISDRDGVLPYIINPNSICTQGYVDLDKVTIVTSLPTGDKGSTSTDSHVVPLLCEQVPRNMLERVKLFYCCVKCGKVFWEGRHFAHVLQQFSHVLSEQ